MPITLIVEDGTNVANANTYADVETVRNYALMRGVTLSADDDKVAVQIITGMDYLATVEWCGKETYDDQSLDWPRKDVRLKGKKFPDNQIPKDLVSALSQLVVEQTNGFALFNTVQPSDLVTEETVGPITTKYADPILVATTGTVEFGAVQPMLDRLTAGCSSSFMSTVRV